MFLLFAQPARNLGRALHDLHRHHLASPAPFPWVPQRRPASPCLHRSSLASVAAAVVDLCLAVAEPCSSLLLLHREPAAVQPQAVPVAEEHRAVP